MVRRLRIYKQLRTGCALRFLFFFPKLLINPRTGTDIGGASASEKGWVGVCPKRSWLSRVPAAAWAGGEHTHTPSWRRRAGSYCRPLLLQVDLICIGEPDLHELSWRAWYTGDVHSQRLGAKPFIPSFPSVPTLLPSSRRDRSVKSRTTRLTNSFYSQAVRLVNTPTTSFFLSNCF